MTTDAAESDDPGRRPAPPDEGDRRRHPPHDGPANDRREIFGWMLYDWANSAFYTTVVGALLGPYLIALAQADVGRTGVVLDLGPVGVVTAQSFYQLFVAVAVGSQVLLLPVVGALADYSNVKKRLMAVFCYTGVAATCLMFFVTGKLYLWGGVLFIVANLCFGGAVVLYNSFLPEIVTEDRRDQVSSRGFALGYLGGGILLALNFVMVGVAPGLLAPLGYAGGEARGLAVRLSLLSAGVWWGFFAFFAFRRLRSRPTRRRLPPGKGYLTAGFAQLRDTFRELRRLPHTLKYLVAYLLYNDGIQTVIGSAAVFIAAELFAGGLDNPEAPSFVLSIFLFVQFMGIGGALLFERVARLLGTKRAILVALVIWTGIVVYAFGFFETRAQAWAIAGLIAVVLGGSQALSRSLFSQMIPKGREASFFGIYEVSERGTSWLGPLVFSIVVARTGSFRYALLSLIVFFVSGMLLLLFTDTARAVHEAGNLLPEEAAAEEEATEV
ncbi:MAG TPA: MFS transporter [Pyrinomonadaceae bacterium]|nr:MFS transporter [Pyrinomonadaceae bacterium]